METSASAAGPLYQKLGKKTFFLFVFDHLKIPVIILMIAAVLYWLGSGTLLAATAIGSYMRYARLGGIIAFVVFAISFISVVMDAWLEYSCFTYALGEDALMIRSGIIAKKQTAIPYNHMESVSVEQDVAHRMLGMSRLVILTAGHEDNPKDKGDAEGVLPAIDTDLAEALQAELLKRTSVEKVSEVSPTPHVGN